MSEFVPSLEPKNVAVASSNAGAVALMFTLAVTQKMTTGALRAIAEAGLFVPKDISLLAFDDCEWFRSFRPFLSTVSQPADDFADHAWAMLMARFHNDRSPKLHKEVNCTLVVRESTIKPPTNLEAEASLADTGTYVR